MLLSKEYLINTYRQEVLEFRTASNENEQWNARKAMAKLENIAMQQYGYEFADKLHNLVDVIKK